MITLFEQPNSYFEVLSGIITAVEFTEAQLLILVKLEHVSNLSRNTDVITLDVSNKFTYSNLLASVGQFCWSSNILDFNKLVGERVMILFKSTHNHYGTFLDFHSMILLNQLQEFKYPNEAGGDDYES